MKHISFWSLLLVFTLSACGRAPAPEPTLDTLAAVINVNTTVDEWDFPIPNNRCSLREAIISANDNSDFGGCTHSGTYGGDTINVPAGTYRLTRRNGLGLSDQDWGDLNVTSPIDLRGSGASTTTIQADFDFVDDFSRILRVGSEQSPDPNVFFAIRRLAIRGGDTTGDGGGLLIGSGDIVEDAVIENNVAGSGGGISSCRGFSIRRTTIRDNTAIDDGGGINVGGCSSSEYSIVNSTIFGNSAGLFGGGLYAHDGTFTITNTTFSSNFATNRGGAITNYFATLNLLNVTITNNLSGNRMGGIDIAHSEGIFTLANTIVAGNSAPIHPDCSGSFSSNGNNLIGIVTSACTGFSNLTTDIRGSTSSPVNPQLGPLADNGGTTRTHALLLGSPALDVANPSLCPTTDQRGTARPLDGNNDGFPICDIGAFELVNLARADLSISLSDSTDPVVVGSDYSYTATVTNLGPDRSAKTNIEFTIPSAATILSTPSGCTSSGNVVTCRVGDILGLLNSGASASQTISVRAPATVPTNGGYSARATTRSSTPEPSILTLANNRVADNTTIIPGAADLKLDLSAVSTILVGSSFNYQLLFANLGPQTAQNVTATLNLPAGLTIGSLDGCTQPSTQVVRCNVASLGSGTGVSKTISVNAPSSPGTLNATATVSSTSPTDPISGNNMDSVNVTVSLPATDIAVLILSPTNNIDVQRNTDITYNVQVRNTIGSANAESTVLTVTFPNTVSNIRTPASCTVSGFTVTCNIGNIPLGSTTLRPIIVRLPNTAMSLDVTAAVSLSNPDPNTANNQLTRTINIQ